MFEEHFYFASVYSRWIEHFDLVLKHMIPLPWFLRPVVGPLIYRTVSNALHGQGMGRHAPHEIHDFARRDLQALVDFLGTKPFLLGDQPTTYDAAIFGSLATVMYAEPFETPERVHITTTFPSLKAYVERVRAVAWPDWDAVCASARTKRAKA